MLKKEGVDSQSQPILEPSVEQYSAEEFINTLYTKTLEWLVEQQEGKVVSRVGPQRISDWDSVEGKHPGQIRSLSIELLKGVVIKTPENNFALALGHKSHGYEDTLIFQFGLQPASENKRFEKLSPVDRLKYLTAKYIGGYGTGEFYQQPITGNVRTNCWADDFKFGGQWINRWEKDEMLTNKGINACLEIIQRTAKNAFKED